MSIESGQPKEFAIFELPTLAAEPVGDVAIYALIDPRDSTVRYIGRTMNPPARLQA